MKDAAILAGVIGAVVLALTDINAYMRYEKTAITAQKAYDLGYAAGKDSVSTPKACVAWWFGQDAKLRHQQAVQAYCKGVK